MTVDDQLEPALSAEEFINVLQRSTLAERRPVDDRELIVRTHAVAGRATRLVLLAAPKVRSYYPHIGMQPHDSCWMLEPVEFEKGGRNQ